jgi:large conductance mechanosensitive channel
MNDFRETKIAGILKEFKEFALKGNVVDLAVAVTIGGAFSKVVTSLVENIMRPPLGYLIGGVDFSHLAFKLNPLFGEPVLWKYGAFLQSVFNFLIILSAVFALVKVMNHLRSKMVEAPEAETPATARNTELLEAILETLQKNKDNANTEKNRQKINPVVLIGFLS